MLGKVKESTVICTFSIGEKSYDYIDYAIVIAWATESLPLVRLAWHFHGNMHVSRDERPKKHIKSLEHAFEQIARTQSHDRMYLFGVVKDFEKKALYYDSEKGLDEYKSSHQDELPFFKQFIKVEKWI
ncbi:MAG: hypothetical protein V4478_02990 [Patescibacteria group bacterium]